MNNKITLPALAAALSARSGISKRQCEEYLKQFFAVCAYALSEGENVKIKGFGTFKIISVDDRKSVDVSTGEEIVIPGHNKIAFVPSRELGERINAPFSIFESVEVADGFDIEADIPEDVEGTVDTPVEAEPVAEPVAAPVVEPEPIAEEEPESDLADQLDEPEAEEPPANNEDELGSEIYVIDSEEQIHDSMTPDDATSETDDAGTDEANEEGYAESVTDNMELERKERRRYGIRRFLAGIACGLVIAAIAGFVTYLVIGEDMVKVVEKGKTESVAKTETPRDSLSQANTPGPAIASADNVEEKNAEKDGQVDMAESNANKDQSYPATEPSDKETKVYDTIGDRRYLTTMAKDHYGNYNLWPYIYEENKSFLGHPDRIKPGTRVVIPPLSKYGVDAKNPADIAKAKKMGVEIYSRY